MSSSSEAQLEHSSTSSDVEPAEEAHEEVSAEVHAEESAIHVSLKPDTLFTIGNFPVTNSLWVSYFLTIVLSLTLLFVSRRLRAVPGKLQLFFETLFTGFYGLILETTKNEKLTKRVFPIFMTIALFFLAANLMGQLPGLMAVEYDGHHLFRPATADYALVLGITVVMFLYWQFSVIANIGGLSYLKKFFNLSSPINFGVGLLEIIGEIAKIISLSFRLFGNVFSEEVLILVMLSIAPFLTPIPFSLLGLLTSVIQAFLFPMLILLFMNMSIAEHAQGHAHGEPAHS
jgi:F-type H+-transporting ATPase subunit a